MKVCIECTASELEQLAETLAAGMAYKDEIKARADLSAKVVRDLDTGDDIPNRFREEGV